MAQGRPAKRASDNAVFSPRATTPAQQRSPIKQRKMGISAHHKQALIDNLQLEITERARRLRAQYSLQAQGLRSRIEIRVNRIPMALRKMRMEDLVLKYSEKEQKSAMTARPPPVPAKDRLVRKPADIHSALSKPTTNLKRTSEDFGRDKENENAENPNKRVRAAEGGHVRPAQVLSPTSSNSRLKAARPVSPAKSQIARPGSPLKSTSRTAAATNMLSNFVEKAKSTRAGTRKAPGTSNTSSTAAPAAQPAKTRRAAPAAAKPPTSRPATRTGRRASATSEASDGSNSTVVRKGAAPRPAPPKKTLGSFTKGTASGDAKKTTAVKSTPKTRAGRVLRNRG